MGFTCYSLGLKKISKYDGLHVKLVALSFLLDQILGLLSKINGQSTLILASQLGHFKPTL